MFNQQQTKEAYMILRQTVVGMLTLLLAFSSLPSALADDQIYLVAYSKFKTGKAPEALKIIREHFFPIDKKIGRQSIPFDFVTGEWDHIVYFPYDAGKMDTVPPRSEWWKALVEQEGGQEKAQKVFQSFLDLHVNSKFEIAKSPGQITGDGNR